MPAKHQYRHHPVHTTTLSPISGSHIDWVITIGFILFFVTICMFIYISIRKQDEHISSCRPDRDLEAYQPLLTEENLRMHQTVTPLQATSPGPGVRSPQQCRIERDARFYDAVASIYRIHVERTGENVESISSDSESIESAGEVGCGAGKGYLERLSGSDDSSESSDSSGSEDSDEEQGSEERGTLGPSEVALPKRIALLRGIR
jgi:hypothetical protein